jgi:hypothetical protein
MRNAIARRRGDPVTLAQGNDAFGTAESARDLVPELHVAQ